MTASAQTSFLIRGGRVYDHDGDVHQPAVADLLISNGKIERVAPDIAPAAGVEIIEARGKLVVPGFVNAHYHSHDAMLKGMFEEMPFDIWALHTNAASYGRRSHQEIRLRTLIGAAEMLRNGITTVQDFLTLVPAEEAYLDTILSAYEEAGIRVVVGIAARDRAALDIAPLMAMDLPQSIRDRLTGVSRPAKQELDFIAAQMRRLGMNPRPLMTWAITPSAPQRCSPELLEGLAALSHEHNLPVFTHVYETRPQAAAARVQSSSLLDILNRAGLMNERLNLVHGVWLASSDIAMLAESGARVVHNPISNLKLKSGMAPILDLHDAGIPIALGCDNYSCAETQNIFVAMRMLCLLPAVTAHEPHLINAAYALRAATLAWRQGRPPRRPGRRAEGRHGGGPDDSRSQRACVRAVQQRGAADRVTRRPAARSRPCWWPAGRSSATASLSPWTRRRSRRRPPNYRRACAARWRRWRRKAPTSFRRCSKAIARPGRSSPA